jgi:broad specificity phosphatase PhoE
VIYLVRHGESMLNMVGVRHGWDDTLLTRVGREQAEQAALSLMHLDRPTVLASPLQRAKHTAQIICSTLGLLMPDGDPIYGLCDELIERPYDGGWRESCEHAAERARRAFATVSGDVVAVTHSGIIKGLLGLAETPPNGSIHEWVP